MLRFTGNKKQITKTIKKPTKSAWISIIFAPLYLPRLNFDLFIFDMPHAYTTQQSQNSENECTVRKVVMLQNFKISVKKFQTYARGIYRRFFGR